MLQKKRKYRSTSGTRSNRKCLVQSTLFESEGNRLRNSNRVNESNVIDLTSDGEEDHDNDDAAVLPLPPVLSPVLSPVAPPVAPIAAPVAAVVKRETGEVKELSTDDRQEAMMFLEKKNYDEIQDDELKILDEKISCPICGIDIEKLTLDDRNIHVNDCFTTDPTMTNTFNVTTQTGYVYKSMKSNNFGNPSTCSLVEDEIEENKKESYIKEETKIKEENKPKRERQPIPQLKILEFKNGDDDNNLKSLTTNFTTKFAVDAFNYRKHDDIVNYFLSHFHSDHYMGITKNWSNGIIYCSNITKKLLILKFKVNEEIIKSLEFDVPYQIPDTDIQVTLIDANHCPGSGIFLFKDVKTNFKILHCGDFRINKEMISKLLCYGKINRCYLDTTYLNPTYDFPKQEDVISITSKFTNALVSGEYSGRKIQQRVTDFFNRNLLQSSNKNKKNYLICIGTYTIGKERIALDIAKTLNCKVYANISKRDILNTFDWPELKNLITDNPYETQVHLIPMGYLNNDNLENYFHPFRNHFTQMVVFRPTGWSYLSQNSTKWMKEMSKNDILMRILLQNRDKNDNSNFKIEQIEKQFNVNRLIQLYQVPYSEHSSFRELSFFVILLDFDKVIPTVNLHSLDAIREMEFWIKEFEEVKKSKLVNMDDF
ncbi:hypothetical protein PACTADRAFT_50483 [Pachysolen tannophilus NRRL Y-2460]|uniref:DNA repair metallo-beta-lactamase domain-containing protein n=1 Tax=Pachysolen tannophilus NRRL Y-2460 TaxID=669874 RepID=A0A1E4TS90_PACTA|nr:hypothetical protein PACTADRAFT_50483 [Pachysolen tannophilus NRRL Y-2460]